MVYPKYVLFQKGKPQIVINIGDSTNESSKSSEKKSSEKILTESQVAVLNEGKSFT